MDIVFASSNPHKLIEVQKILGDVIPMNEVCADLQIIENGNSYGQNALKKAMSVMFATNKVTIADDSGLEIKHLDNAPGIYSARFLGDTSYREKCEHIIELLTDAKDRTAKFTTAIALVFPSGKKYVTEASLDGVIADKIYGENGFGYDPIFYVPEYKMTIAQMPPELKNEISHRRKALELIKKHLEAYYN